MQPNRHFTHKRCYQVDDDCGECREWALIEFEQAGRWFWRIWIAAFALAVIGLTLFERGVL